ncbi:uncharacterized protein LOC109839998 [Asparagus officinalis]|uniref:uncharacterized protein LOC109839998 n=1 Tax=Asparagus officinalis TaxID=4686 RepID=UPI00098E07CD|nr:uncharacterized protein LOC109839998 [Asparagus officinalis]
MKKKKKNSNKKSMASASDIRDSIFVYPSQVVDDASEADDEADDDFEFDIINLDAENIEDSSHLENRADKSIDLETEVIDKSVDENLEKSANENLIDEELKENTEPEPRKSFVSLFVDNRKSGNGLSLSFFPSAQSNTVSFNTEEWTEGEVLWKSALLGHVIGLNTKFKAMESFVNKFWGKISILKISIIKQGLFLFYFQTEKQMRDVLEAGPWFFGSRPLMLKPWSIDTDLENLQDFYYPMWVQFPNLRLNLWSSTGISKVASLIGKPIATDKLTATRQRLSYARVLLEVKFPLKEPLPDQLIIQGPDGRNYTQPVLYEFKPRWCTLCSMVGHNIEQCRRNRAKKVWVPIKKQVGKETQANSEHYEMVNDSTIQNRTRGETSKSDSAIPVAKHAQTDTQTPRDRNITENLVNEKEIAPNISNQGMKDTGGYLKQNTTKHAQQWAVNHLYSLFWSNNLIPLVKIKGDIQIMHFAIWNIRGFNKSSKHRIVKQLIQDYNISFLALLETKLPESKMQMLARKITKDWKWISNAQGAIKGRIWILWDNEVLTVQNVVSSDQYMTCSIVSRDGRITCLCTIVYALNQMIARKTLWNDLLAYKQNVNCPWVIGGDFNAIISSDEKIGGAPISQADTEDFQSFISSSQLTHIRSTGCFFTWCNKQEADSRIWSRLDRCLVNDEWIHNYTSSQVEFLNPSCSDHSPALLTIGDDVTEGKRPFKIFNMWAKHS